MNQYGGEIPSGEIDRVVPFYANGTIGLTGFTVQRRRNGGALTAMTTPTITEVDQTDAPGMYELLLDEDTTIDTDNEREVMWFFITAPGMQPVVLTVTLVDAGGVDQAVVEAGVNAVLNVNNGVVESNIEEVIGNPLKVNGQGGQLHGYA
jgi:hypothetical protein